MIINLSDRRGNAHASGHITSNFLTQASWMLYEIRQPPTSLCTTSNFITNEMVLMVIVVKVLKMVIMVKMLIMVEMLIMVKMVIMVDMVIMVE